MHESTVKFSPRKSSSPQSADPDDMEDILRHVRRGVEARNIQQKHTQGGWVFFLKGRLPKSQGNLDKTS